MVEPRFHFHCDVHSLSENTHSDIMLPQTRTTAGLHMMLLNVSEI